MVGTVAFLFTFLPGLDWAFKKYDVPESYFNGVLVLLFLVYVAGAAVVLFRNRGQTKSHTSSGKRKSKRFAVGYISLTGVLLVLFLHYFSKENISDLLLTENLPRIAAAIDNGHNMQAFREIKSLLRIHPENQILKHYLEKSTRLIEVTSVPSGVSVHVKYGSDSTWVHLGATPLDSIAVPLVSWDRDPFQLKFQIAANAYLVPPGNSGKFDLTGMGEVPADHAFIPGLDARIMWFPGIDLGQISYGPFSISKTEVSNTEYQAFVNHVDYKNPSYWDFPVTINGTEHTFEQALRTFSGKFGKPGPANWSYGSFPVDQGNYPVTGISWFEARAYARFRNMKLPNVYQWLVAARLSQNFILPDIRNSNLKSAVLREVDDPADMNFHGLMNIAGNVKEWATNPHGDGLDRLSILGGAYYDNLYNFNDYYSASPLDRSIGNGMRLVQSVGRETPESLNDKPVIHVKRDILSESNVSDEVFEVYRTQFDYTPYPLDVDVEIVPGHPTDYVVERFEMLPPYENDEPLHGYIIYRKDPKRKLKPVLIFPGAGSIYTNTDTDIVPWHMKHTDYLLREGYAIVHPVYFSTYNRRKTLTTWWANETEQYKDSIVKIGKDFRRIIDYLESRKDIDARNITYQGYSWGSLMSNTLLAIDQRVRSAFVCVGGLQLPRSQRAIDPALFIRRVRTPIMHITGKLDGVFEYETSQIPMQKLLGTPKRDQKMIVLEDVGHGIPRDTIIVNHLAWIKKYELR
jgi:dienelactone hydrolase